MLEPTNYTISHNLLSLAQGQLPNIDSRLAINQPTGDFFTEQWELKPEFSNTVWQEIYHSVREPKGEARLIKMAPGQCYPSHSDIDDRWHLTITGSHSYLIDLDNQSMYPTIPNGQWWLMNAGKRHSAANFGSESRIQLVVRKLLPIITIANPVDIAIKLKKIKYDYRFVFDDILSPWLNSAFKRGVISHFKRDENVINLVIEKNNLNELKKLTNEYFTIDEY